MAPGTPSSGGNPPKPLFLKEKDLPYEVPVHELCTRCELVGGKDSVEGAQVIKGLWRIFVKTEDARVLLLMEGISMRGHAVTLSDTDPYKQLDSNGREVVTTQTTNQWPAHVHARLWGGGNSWQIGCWPEVKSNVWQG